MIFKIGSYDFTKCIVMDSYEINTNDVYSSYTDANGVDHRKVIRSKTSGSIDMYFRNDDLQTLFTNVINSEKTTDGYYIVTALSNNTAEVVTINAYLTCTPKRTTVGSRDTLAQFTLTVEER